MRSCTGIILGPLKNYKYILIIKFRITLPNALCRSNGLIWKRPWNLMFRAPSAAETRDGLQWREVNLLDRFEMFVNQLEKLEAAKAA